MVEQENSIIDDEDDEGSDYSDSDIDEAAHVKLQKFQRLRVGRLIPRELLFAFVAGFIVLVAIALWTVYNSNEELISEFDERPLWTMSFYTSVREQRDFNALDKQGKQAVSQLSKQGGQLYANALANLGVLYMRNGRWQQALDCFQKWKTAHTDKTSANTAQNLYNLALCQYQLGDEVHAEVAFRECLDVARQAGAGDSPAILPACQGLLAIFTRRGDLQSAQDSAHQILKIFDNPLSKTIPYGERNFWLSQIADTERRMHNYRISEDLFKRALDGGLRGEQSVDTAKALFGLSLSYLKQHKFQDAERALRQSHLLAQATMGPNDPLLLSIRQQYAQCLWKTNWIAALALNFTAADQPKPQP